MAVTAGIIVGDLFRIYIDDEPVGYATSGGVEFSRETKQTLHKDNYTGGTGWATYTLGTASGNFSCEAFFSQDGFNTGTHASPFDIYSLLANGTESTIQYRIPAASDSGDDKYWEFDAFITGMSVTAPTNDNATFSVNGVINGEPTVVTVT